VRWMYVASLKDRISSKELNERMGVVCVAEVVRQGRLRRLGQPDGKGKDEWVSAWRIVLSGERGRSRFKKAYKDTWNWTCCLDC